MSRPTAHEVRDRTRRLMERERVPVGTDDPTLLALGARPFRPWLHQIFDNPRYRWVVKNRLMRDDRLGVELTYRDRMPDDVICGARTIHPGIPDFKGYSWRMDQSVDHEVVCTVVGDHGEVPHVGVPADCADMTCQCSRYGCYHLVIVGFTVRNDLSRSAVTDQPDDDQPGAFRPESGGWRQ